MSKRALPIKWTIGWACDIQLMLSNGNVFYNPKVDRIFYPQCFENDKPIMDFDFSVFRIDDPIIKKEKRKWWKFYIKKGERKCYQE